MTEEKREQTQCSATRTRGTRQPEDGTVAPGLAPCLVSGAAGKGRAPDCQITSGLASWSVTRAGKGARAQQQTSPTARSWEGRARCCATGSPCCHRCGPTAEHLAGSCRALPSACLHLLYKETVQDEKNVSFCFTVFCWYLAVVVLLPDLVSRLAGVFSPLCSKSCIRTVLPLIRKNFVVAPLTQKRAPADEGGTGADFLVSGLTVPPLALLKPTWSHTQQRSLSPHFGCPE